MSRDPRVYVAKVDMGMIWKRSSPTREDQEKSDATLEGGGYFVTRIFSSHANHHGERSLQFARMAKKIGENKVIRQFQECSQN